MSAAAPEMQALETRHRVATSRNECGGTRDAGVGDDERRRDIAEEMRNAVGGVPEVELVGAVASRLTWIEQMDVALRGGEEEADAQSGRIDVRLTKRVIRRNDGCLLESGIGAVWPGRRMQSVESLVQSCAVDEGRHERFGQVEVVRLQAQAGASLTDVVKHLVGR